MIIFLIGFMGSGKSYWTRKLGEATGIPTHDMDEILEKEEGMSCLQIFENKGEHYFREKEAKLLRQLIKLGDNRIISCGGGTPIYKNNIELMNTNGVTVYLKATPDYLLKSLLNDKNSANRALIKNIHESELLFFINQKLGERLPFYNQSQLTFDVEKITLSDLQNIFTNA